MSDPSPSNRSALPTPEEIRADPDRILELYDCCPKCGSTALEALTWKSIGSDDVTVGCWSCDWMLHPPGWTPPSEQNDKDQATPAATTTDINS